MTNEEAREEMPDFKWFRHECCEYCSNDWYCPSDCDFLVKARSIPFSKIQECYARHNGDWQKISSYIKRTHCKAGDTDA